MGAIGWGLLAAAVLVVLLTVVMYNRLVGLRNQVQNAWRQIERLRNLGGEG